MNTRKVDWNNFQPDFFVSFQPGELDPARRLSSPTQTGSLYKTAVTALPNISIINVAQIVERILNIMDQISWAIRVMAYLSIFAGLVVLFSIARCK